MPANITSDLLTQNESVAKSRYPLLSTDKIDQLRLITLTHRVSLSAGDLLLIEGNWYITHTGLLRIASEKKCAGIRTFAEMKLSDPAVGRWVFKATVYKSRASKGFIGYGDASPANVSPRVYGSEMRIAETRAVNRALRKAYAIGICSYEELGPQRNGANGHKPAVPPPPPTLRERLCALISEHNLDASAVKRYAAEFCGTQELRQATRELVEDFIEHLSTALVNDRDALFTKLKEFETGGVQ